tara:strand:- start:331 stop:660 length:330 start_codon:yes stop_codon:yes gene_type:complete
MDSRQRDYAERIREEGEMSDGGKHLLKCSACDKELVEIWITKKELDVRFKLRAECAYCGDYSFPVEVEGGFHLGITDDCIMDEYVAEEINSREADRITDAYLIKTRKNQ